MIHFPRGIEAPKLRQTPAENSPPESSDGYWDPPRPPGQYVHRSHMATIATEVRRIASKTRRFSQFTEWKRFVAWFVCSHLAAMSIPTAQWLDSPAAGSAAVRAQTIR